MLRNVLLAAVAMVVLGAILWAWRQGGLAYLLMNTLHC